MGFGLKSVLEYIVPMFWIMVDEESITATCLLLIVCHKTENLNGFRIHIKFETFSVLISYDATGPSKGFKFDFCKAVR